MARVIVTSSADADTANILAYLAAKAGGKVAARYLESFERLYDRLAEHPHSGAPRPALGPHVRIAIVAPYIVIYEHSDLGDTVAISRIVDGRRRITGTMLSAGIRSR